MMRRPLREMAGPGRAEALPFSIPPRAPPSPSPQAAALAMPHPRSGALGVTVPLPEGAASAGVPDPCRRLREPPPLSSRVRPW